MSPNGWIRIGIVLSVLWMVGGTGYFWVKEANRNLRYAIALTNERSNCIGNNGTRRALGQPEAACTSEPAIAEAYSQGVVLWLVSIGIQKGPRIGVQKGPS